MKTTTMRERESEKKKVAFADDNMNILVVYFCIYVEREAESDR